jgi:hypothetical protein
VPCRLVESLLGALYQPFPSFAGTQACLTTAAITEVAIRGEAFSTGRLSIERFADLTARVNLDMEALFLARNIE